MKRLNLPLMAIIAFGMISTFVLGSYTQSKHNESLQITNNILNNEIKLLNLELDNKAFEHLREEALKRQLSQTTVKIAK
jgi:hypothetical protein